MYVFSYKNQGHSLLSPGVVAVATARGYLPIQMGRRRRPILRRTTAARSPCKDALRGGRRMTGAGGGRRRRRTAGGRGRRLAVEGRLVALVAQAEPPHR